jgi:nucleoside-diphosphate-sugar epimerase
MKILFTGCSGFIGKAVLDEAVKKYGQEHICALSSSIIKGIKTIIHHGYAFNPCVFIENGLEDIETLIHIGAFTPKDQTEANDIKRCNANIFNTEKIICAKLPNLKKIIFLSTLDVYADADVISEDSGEGPVSLYGWSKLYCEKMIENFSEQNNLTRQILRIGHVFGPGEEKYKKLIPNTITNLLKNNAVELFGDGQAVRTFIYIDDVVKAVLNAVDLSRSEGVINVVGGTPITIESLAKILVAIHGQEAGIRYIPTAAKNRNLIFDNKKLRETLLDEFTPVPDGLRKEYQYMKEKTAGEPVL